MELVVGAICLILLLSQISGTFILLARLIPGLKRPAPLEPQIATPEQLGVVSIVVPTLNEVERLSPCLTGLSQQSYEVREIIFVDSNSEDGTREKIKAQASRDPRFRLFTDDPLPAGWVGRPWALHNGFLASSPHSQWLLGIDADTLPQPGLVASLLKVAVEGNYDLVSLAPQFILKYPGEWWLQPALLVTLLYRAVSPGVNTSIPERVMANGQCFLCRRSVLEQIGGYQVAADSFCDDITLARYLATQGLKVGFLDGYKVIQVRMYEGFWDTWHGWGRSLDLKDAQSFLSLWGDIWLLKLVQAFPLPVLLIGAILWLQGYHFLTLELLLAVNSFLLLLRIFVLIGIQSAYRGLSANNPSSWWFWLSPLADPLAWSRILLSALTTPKRWRGRIYN